MKKIVKFLLFIAVIMAISGALTAAWLGWAAAAAAAFSAALGAFCGGYLLRPARSAADFSELAMANTSDLVAVVDLQGRRIYNSPSYSLLADPARLKGSDSFNEIHPEDREKVKEIFRRTVQSGRGERAEYRFLLPDGSVRFIESMGNVVRGGDGEPHKVVIVSRDVTERKKMELQLRQAQKMEAMGLLAGGVAHDFNNIIAALLAYAEFIIQAAPAGGSIADDAGEIKKVCKRAAALSRQLLAFSRRQMLSPRVLDLNAVVTGIQKMLSRLIGEHIELVIQGYPEEVPALADPGQMEQVLLNLTVNARDAMPGGGRLTIKVFPCEYTDYLLGSEVIPGKYAVISVTDTGSGMDAAVKAHLFEPFFTTKGPGSGTGLGLSTVYGIVKQSGGHIDVDSEEGRGSTFTVYLPLSQAPAEKAAPAAAAMVRGGRETVLLVEDDTALRSATRRMLQENGYKVLEAASGSEAELIAGRCKVDLLLTDVVLPGVDGFALAESLARANPGLARVYISGYTDPAVIKKEFIGPESPLIQKPFSSETLLLCLRAALDAARA